MTKVSIVSTIQYALMLVLSQAAAGQADVIPYTIERTEIREIHSDLLDRDYHIFLKLPRSHGNDKRKYPVLFLNDAGYAFPLVSSLERQMGNAGIINEFIIVGISYSTGDSPGLSRTRDYTPTNSPNESSGYSAATKRASGQAEVYLNFITSELFPFIESNYQADMDKKILAGHSFGGLFASYVVATASASFEYSIISDPSLWYHNKVVLSMVKEEVGSSPNVLIVVANPQPENDSGFISMVSNVLELEEILQTKFGSDNVESMTFGGEIHETIFPIAMTRGLRAFLK